MQGLHFTLIKTLCVTTFKSDMSVERINSDWAVCRFVLFFSCFCWSVRSARIFRTPVYFGETSTRWVLCSLLSSEKVTIAIRSKRFSWRKNTRRIWISVFGCYLAEMLWVKCETVLKPILEAFNKFSFL